VATGTYLRLFSRESISGKTPTELDQLPPDTLQQLKTTAALFPDTLVDSELGEIPAGWRWSEIGNEVTVVGGGTPSTKKTEFWEGGNIHWTTPKDMSNLTDKVLLETARKITKAGLEKISSGLLPENTVLMSSRAPVGYLAISKVPIAINQGYIAMKCESELSAEYVVQWADSGMNEIKQRASGTTFAEISKKNFKIIPVVVPDAKIISEYSKVVSDIYLKITNGNREAKDLKDLRDTLLPKLLSGELSVMK
jgi:type I restriction enzyme S subunit